jgi:hypothetical protein
MLLLDLRPRPTAIHYPPHSRDPFALARLIGRLLEFLGWPEGNLLARLDLDGLARGDSVPSWRPASKLEPKFERHLLLPLRSCHKRVASHIPAEPSGIAPLHLA